MPVDAYPISRRQWWRSSLSGRDMHRRRSNASSQFPTEVEMNGVPKMSVMRSISLYGLSDVILTFDEGTDDYFARQVVFQRLSEVTYPTGVTPPLRRLQARPDLSIDMLSRAPTARHRS